MDAFESAKQHFIGGLQSLQANDVRTAESRFTRSLELLPGRVSTLNNLAAVKLRLNKFAEAVEFARKALALEPDSSEAWCNLGAALLKMEQPGEALQAHEQALGSNFMFSRAWHGKAEALLKLDRFAGALAACEEALRLEPAESGFLFTQSLILKALGRRDEARKAYVNAFARRVVKTPFYSAERRPGQRGDCLIVSLDPCLDDELKSFDALQLEAPNYPSQLFHRLADDFHFTLAFSGEVLNPETRARIPRPDFIINNCTNGELLVSGGELPALSASLDSFDVPVVNHPLKAAQTGRDAAAKKLENLPGVRVPKTMRFSSEGRPREELIRDIEAHFNYPLITRTLTMQRGIGMSRSDSREALLETIASGLPEKFFVTEFIDSRGGGELYRKLRAAVVADEIVVVRADYDTFWNVHGRRVGPRAQYYLDHPEFQEMEHRICADPEKELGRAAMQSLRAIRGRIPLDIFGVDFGVDADGTVIFYEANATMNLLTNYKGKLTNPLESNERLMQLFRRYLASLVERKG